GAGGEYQLRDPKGDMLLIRVDESAANSSVSIAQDSHVILSYTFAPAAPEWIATVRDEWETKKARGETVKIDASVDAIAIFELLFKDWDKVRHLDADEAVALAKKFGYLFPPNRSSIIAARTTFGRLALEVRSGTTQYTLNQYPPGHKAKDSIQN